MATSVSPRKHALFFSTRNPPAVQRIPWPDRAEGDQVETEETVAPRRARPKAGLASYDTWVLNDQDFEFLVEPEGASSPANLNFNIPYTFH